MNYVALLLALVTGFGKLLDLLQRQQIIDGAGAMLISDALKGQADDIAKAHKATQAVVDAAAHDPNSVLRDDDGFRRD